MVDGPADAARRWRLPPLSRGTPADDALVARRALIGASGDGRDGPGVSVRRHSTGGVLNEIDYRRRLG